ncbi:MAG TPA: TlpA disulfide reductase family protein [Acidobacteriaceae bacterium]
MSSSLKDVISRNIGTAALTTMLALSLGLNVYLASNGGLRPHPKPVALLKPGASVPSSISMEDATGKPVRVNFADDTRPTVLYVLSPQCGWCKRNEANMKALYAADSDKYRFVGVSLVSQNLAQYVSDKREPFPVYLLPSKDVMEKLHVIGTPETIVVGPDAKVIHAWSGVYIQQNQPEVEKYFGVKLPGLPQTARLDRP